MTSDFDSLRTIEEKAKEDKRFEPLANFVKDKAVADCTKVDKTFTFEKWKEGKHGKVCVDLYGEEGAKWEYLSDCHSVLDHGKYHLRCFTGDTARLIGFVDNLFRGYDIIRQRLKSDLKKETRDKLIELVTACGIDESDPEFAKFSIQLKDVKRP